MNTPCPSFFVFTICFHILYRHKCIYFMLCLLRKGFLTFVAMQTATSPVCGRSQAQEAHDAFDELLRRELRRFSMGEPRGFMTGCCLGEFIRLFKYLKASKSSQLKALVSAEVYVSKGL